MSQKAECAQQTGKEVPEPLPPTPELEQPLQPVQALLLKLIEQGQIAFRVQESQFGTSTRDAGGSSGREGGRVGISRRSSLARAR